MSIKYESTFKCKLTFIYQYYIVAVRLFNACKFPSFRMSAIHDLNSKFQRFEAAFFNTEELISSKPLAIFE